MVTDHAALQHFHTAKTKNPKLARWALLLSNYDFQVMYRPGKVHTNADGLSRSRQADAPLESGLDVMSSHLDSAVAALEADASAGNLDGDPICMHVDAADTANVPFASATIS